MPWCWASAWRSPIALPASLPALEGGTQVQPPGWIAPYRADAQRLIAAATADQFAWDRLAELTDTFGARLTGSENLTRAIAWAAETMKADGLDRVRTEKVMGPKWVRGQESLEIVDPPITSSRCSAWAAASPRRRPASRPT